MVGDGKTYHQQQDTKFATSKFRSLSKNLRRPRYQDIYLTELQGKYVLVPADKAGNNIIFVCKYYYIRTLMEELDINSGTNLNSTYINQVNTVDELIQTHATTLADVFNIKLQQKEKNLPQIYSVNRQNLLLSKLITECLKLVRSHCTAYRSSIIRWTLSVHWRRNKFHSCTTTTYRGPVAQLVEQRFAMREVGRS